MSSTNTLTAPPSGWRQKLIAYLALARISNTPTVVTNVLAGAALGLAGSGRGVIAPLYVMAAVSLSMVLFYTAGMVLNDICDYEFDKRKRADRPLVTGAVSMNEDKILTQGLFVVGSVLLAFIDIKLMLLGFVLAGVITLYDTWHKGNVLSPVIMAINRILVYVIAFVAFYPEPTTELWIASGLLLSYMVGLTFIAKSETEASFSKFWPLIVLYLPVVYFLTQFGRADQPLTLIVLVGFVAWIAYSVRFVYQGRIGKGITSLIAGISLFDALVILIAGSTGWVWLALLGFVLTIFFQNYIKGS
jgi:4-hydroxybenzoate polyprenyltransferase